MQTPRRLAALVTVALVSVLPIRAQDASPTGRWSGTISTPGQPLAVVVSFVANGGELRGTIDIPAQGAAGLALAKVSRNGSKIEFTIGGIPGDPTFHGRLDGDRIAGTFTQGGASFPFALSRAAAPAPEASTAGAGDSAPTQDAMVDSIRAFLGGAIERWKVPGLAVTVVRDGRVILADGFGLRDVEASKPVTASTLMPIGSSTKAFTAFIIGTLVDEGKLEWDKPVVEYLPEFRLADEAATRLLRVRDLLTHVSGLPRHDVVWYGSSLSRAELFDRLRYLDASAPVRSKWQYNNLMYMTAGVLAERVSGRSWETLVRERIFEPLAMSTTTTSLADLARSADRAVGYEMTEKRLTAVDYRSAEAMGPAGAINSSASEMARWVQLQIDGGMFGGRALISNGSLAEIHAPQVVIPTGPAPAGNRLLFNLYAMGWMEHAYRGRRLIEHGGNIDGFSAEVGFLPAERIGVVVLANRGGTGLPTAALRTIVDILLDERDFDWEARGLAGGAGLDSLLDVNRRIADDGVRTPNTRPSHAMSEYAGEFEHPAYGVVTVRQEHDRLRIELHGIAAALEHYHYDVFRVTGAPGPIDGMLVEFRTATTGEIATLLAPLEPSVAPIEFTRRASEQLRDTAVLDRYVGVYALAGQRITVARRGVVLYVTVPGQPEYELVPGTAATFALKGLSGFSVRFTPRTGRAERAVFVQPNGTFAAEREGR